MGLLHRPSTSSSAGDDGSSSLFDNRDVVLPGGLVGFFQGNDDIHGGVLPDVGDGACVGSGGPVCVEWRLLWTSG